MTLLTNSDCGVYAMSLSSDAIVRLSRAVLICVLLLTGNFPALAQTPTVGRQAGANNEHWTEAILWTQSSAEPNQLFNPNRRML
jgi:hypothetical protein